MEYPTKKQLQLLAQLIQDGPRSLEPSEPAPGRRKGRSRNLATLRGLLRRLDLERLIMYVDDVSHQDVLFLDPRVSQGAYLKARSRGLILRRGTGLPPWTSQQAHLVTLLGQGAVYESLSELTGLSKPTLAYHMQCAREATGTATNCSLIARAYQRGWLPCDAEMHMLTSRSSEGSSGGVVRL